MSGRNRIDYAGHKVRKARLQAAIATQKELAEKTGIPANIISDLERGKRRMSPAWAQRLANVLGGDWTDFMDNPFLNPRCDIIPNPTHTDTSSPKTQYTDTGTTPSNKTSTGSS